MTLLLGKCEQMSIHPTQGTDNRPGAQGDLLVANGSIYDLIALNSYLKLQKKNSFKENPSGVESPF